MSLLVTVIIPVYNTEEYLRICFDSISNQTYKNLEIVVIDDGSTDSSPAICDAYAKSDSRVSVIHKENQGVSAARNLGIGIGTGDYISFVDSDDWLEPDTYEHLISCVVKYKVDAVMFEYFVDCENGKSVHKTHKKPGGVVDKGKAIESTISPDNRFAWSKIYAKKLLCHVRFEPGIYIGEDTLFACNALHNANSVYYTPKPLYHYVQSAISATRCAFNNKRFTGIEAYYQLITLCQKNYPEIVGVALSAYIFLTISIIIDLCGNRDYPDSHKIINQLNGAVRRHCYRLLFSNKVTMKAKIKLVMCCINPKIAYGLHKCRSSLLQASVLRRGSCGE